MSLNISNLTKKSLSPTTMIATSLILKDAVGCFLYVSQSRSNKKMTPQQRADVANYDLANGVINVGLQLLAVKPIETAMKKFVEKNWIKHFFTNMDEKVNPNNNYKDVMKFLKNKKLLSEGAVALLSVIICQYFIKRVVSPFFSVPAGEKTKQWGIIKPKIYEGEEYNGKGVVDKCYDNFKYVSNKTYQAIDNSPFKKIRFQDRFEKNSD